MLLGAAAIGFFLGWLLQKLQQDRLRADLRFTSEKLQAAIQKENSLGKELAESRRVTEDLRARKDSLVKELEQQKETGVDAEGSLARRLERENDGASDEQTALIEKLRAEIADALERTRQLEAENETLRGREEAAKGEEAGELERLQKEVQRLEARYRELEDEYQDLEERMEAAEARKAPAVTEKGLLAEEEEEEEEEAGEETVNENETRETSAEESPESPVGEIPSSIRETVAEVPGAPLTAGEIQRLKKTLLNSVGHASEARKDNLVRIAGIGPYIEAKLNSIGIYTYGQIARLSPEDIDYVTRLIEFFPGRIVRDDWPGQAKKLLDNKNGG